DNDDEEVEIAEKLIRNHINYRRSNNDIEMMTINAER
ncbi:MAG: ABC transporter ATP-binding protein, partial [Mogibacterium diversum]|nr:ABC transporter ATP-binding protein [Mogibacterium diversum]